MPQTLQTGFVLFAICLGIAVALGLLALVLRSLGLLKPRASAAAPYRCQDRLLSPAETAYYRSLLETLPILTAAAGKSASPILLAKPRLSDVLATDSKVLQASDDQRGFKSRQTTAQNKINSKHVDFLLCDPETTRPLIVIELDDASHRRQDRRERDGFVDRACEAAGLPILRVKCRAPGVGYDPRQLAREIAAALAA